MTDPAVAAAARAWEHTTLRGERPDEMPWTQSIDAAREALDPIRDALVALGSAIDDPEITPAKIFILMVGTVAAIERLTFTADELTE